ncbi:hypothetical protein [Mesorhizobium sp.]|uniref:hypothetical protein n=1 Tax=Mesorhizobium sp. TaxID=1871066 RepID=UPI00345CA502
MTDFERLCCRLLVAGRVGAALHQFSARFEMFKGRQFDQAVILLCMRWYLAYDLSLRDLKEMMAGIGVDHSTIHRWVHSFRAAVAGALQPPQACRHRQMACDETYIKVRGEWMYRDRTVSATRSNSGSASIATCWRQAFL